MRRGGPSVKNFGRQDCNLVMPPAPACRPLPAISASRRSLLIELPWGLSYASGIAEALEPTSSEKGSSRRGPRVLEGPL